MKLKEVCEKLGGILQGDGEVEIAGLNTIEAARPDELTFYANPQYHQFLKTTKAGGVIVGADVEALGLNLIRLPDPHYGFCQALSLFYPQPGSDVKPGISEKATIHKSVKLGKGVHIGNYVEVEEGTIIGDNARIMTGCYLGKHCRIGSNSLIYPNVTIYYGTIIGDNVTIHSGVVIGADGFGYATYGGIHQKVLQVGIVRIEDNVEIGANTCLDRAALGETVIGEGTKIDNLVQIAHHVHTGKRCLIVAQVGISGSTTLGEYVILGGQAGAVGHVHIGDRAVMAGGSIACKSLAGDKTYGGYPAREMNKYKRATAEAHHLPEKMKRLRRLEQQVAKLTEQLEVRERD